MGRSISQQLPEASAKKIAQDVVAAHLVGFLKALVFFEVFVQKKIKNDVFLKN